MGFSKELQYREFSGIRVQLRNFSGKNSCTENFPKKKSLNEWNIQRRTYKEILAGNKVDNQEFSLKKKLNYGIF